MSLPVLCAWCEAGDHARHYNPPPVPGLIGGTYCPCPGGCVRSTEFDAQTWPFAARDTLPDLDETMRAVQAMMDSSPSQADEAGRDEELDELCETLRNVGNVRDAANVDELRAQVAAVKALLAKWDAEPQSECSGREWSLEHPDAITHYPDPSPYPCDGCSAAESADRERASILAAIRAALEGLG
jgi:hypothetical protein